MTRLFSKEKTRQEKAMKVTSAKIFIRQAVATTAIILSLLITVVVLAT